VLLVVGFLFSFLKFDMFGMGQDQGVYQVNALLMIDGLESNVVPVKEYELLTNDEDRALFLEQLKQQELSWLGFNAIEWNENRGTISPGTNPVNSAIFHGLVNLPALLSISGMIFGAEHLMHALTLPYLVSIVLIFLTLNVNLGFSKSTSFIPTLIFALSPIVLWTSKASLTEIYLTMIIAMLMFYLTDKERNSSWMLWIPVAAFAFFHVSIYTVMPMIVLIFIGMTIYQRSLGAWVSGVISVIMFALGYLAMTYASPQYTFDNYWRIFELINRFGFNFDRTSTHFIFIFPACFAALCLFGLAYYFYIHKSKAAPDIKRALPIILQIATIVCICFIFYRLYRIARATPVFNNAYDRYHGAGFLRNIPNLRAFAHGFGSGFVLLAIALFAILRGDKRLFTKDVFPLTLIFAYNIIFVSAFLSTDVPYYYYFSRYNVPYVPALVVLGGVAFSRFRISSKLVAAVLSVCFMIPFSATLALNRDISTMQLRSQREVVEVVREMEPGSIILVDGFLRRFFFNSISFGTESYVFTHSLYSQLNDTSFVDGRNVYTIFTSDEVADTPDSNVVYSTISRNSALPYWITGWWNPGLRNLLRPDIWEYYINIAPYT
jgi:hypothetical protein